MKSFVPKLVFTALLIGVFQGSYGQAIRLHPENPHYFQFQGEPLILITSAEHYGAVLNLDYDYDTYLRTLGADGMNYTRIFSGSYVEKPGAFGIEKNTLAPLPERLVAPWIRSDTPGYVNGGNKFDLDRWDPVYFERLKDFVGKAGQHDIIVEVTLFCALYDEALWQMSPLHAVNNINEVGEIPREDVHTLKNGKLLLHQERLVRTIVRELNEFDNVFFEIQNEPYAIYKVTAAPINPYLRNWQEEWQNRVDLPVERNLEWQRRVAAWIKDEQKNLPKKHLIAQNFSNFRYPIPTVDPSISILNFHYAWPEVVNLNYGYDRVIGFDESGFSGSADVTYRKQAWKFILAGGALFNNLDYSFTTEREDGSDTNQAPGGGSPALRQQLRVLSDFMHSLDFVRMKPDARTVLLAPNAFPQALSAEGEAYAIYFDGRLTGDILLDLPPGQYDASWISTRSGQTEKEERLVHEGGRLTLTGPSYEEDIALKILRTE